MNGAAWLRPEFLWALPAVALPVVIHLLGRRRKKTVPIATLRFLEKARAKAATRWRLKRILLLLSRMAAVACLISLFAGPGCQLRAAGEAPGNRGLVLDVSPSMLAERDGVKRLEEAKTALLRVVDGAEEEARFAFVTTGKPQGDADASISLLDRSVARERILRAEIEGSDGGMVPAIERAAAALEGAGGGEIAAAGDLQRRAWRDLDSLARVSAVVRVVDVGLADGANGWIEDIVREDEAFRVRLGWSGASAPPPREVRLRDEGGAALTAFVADGEAVFRPRLDARPRSLAVTAKPGGDLAADDEIALSAASQGAVRVLLVNGDPRGFEILDELLFVRGVLAAGEKIERRFAVRAVRQADLDAKDFEEVDVVLLANPGPISGDLADAVVARVRRGMGVVVAAGDQWTAEESGGGLDRLLAAPLRDRVVLTGDDPARAPYEEIETETLAGPLDAFRKGTEGRLDGARVRGYWLTEVGAGGGVRTWARLRNQVPLVVERAEGEGRLLLLATSVDRDWADLCLQPAFLPFVEDLFFAAAGRVRRETAPLATVGEPLSAHIEEPVTVTDPEGRATSWRPGDAPFVPTLPGVHRVEAGGRWIGAFTARFDPRESNLERIPMAEITAAAAKRGVTVGAAEAVEGMGRRDLSRAVSIGLLAALFAEALLAARWRGLFGRTSRETLGQVES
jgi:hypothetical protein